MPKLTHLARIVGLRVVQVTREIADTFTRRSRPWEIVAYRGYGSPARVYVHGRVLRRPLHSPPTATDRAWRNLLNTYRRARSAPIPYARVCARLGESSAVVRADDEGFFGVWLDSPAELVDKHGWVDAKLELESPRASKDSPAITTDAKVLIPPPSARFGVISDLDDTVIQSRISNFLQAMRTVMFGNALTRLPFAGVAEFYAALAGGGSGDESNPLFYVSSSPWNIYDVIEDFLKMQGIPIGPVLLRDWDFDRATFRALRHHGHKGEAIREVLATYPALPFILIGDSGQQDPEIYSQIVHEYPTRIMAVYIRDVVRSQERRQALMRLAAEVHKAGSELLAVEETPIAAAHAAERGWIKVEEIAPVAKEAAADTGATNEKKPAAGAAPATAATSDQ